MSDKSPHTCTPETDAARLSATNRNEIIRWTVMPEMVHASFAASLERQRDEARAELSRAEHNWRAAEDELKMVRAGYQKELAAALQEAGGLRARLNGPPSYMSYGEKMVPANSDGMRHVIDDNVNLRAELTAANERAVKAEADLKIHIENSKASTSRLLRINEDNAHWKMACINARLDNEPVIQECLALRRAIAAKDAAIRDLLELDSQLPVGMEESSQLRVKIIAALSPASGQGWVNPEKVEEFRSGVIAKENAH